MSLAAALGFAVCWPIACLWTIRAAQGVKGWDLPREGQYRVVLPVIALRGAVGSFLLLFGVQGAVICTYQVDARSHRPECAASVSRNLM